MTFRDGFELGFTPWDERLEQGGLVQQTTEQIHSGQYACKIIVNDVAGQRRARVGKHIIPNKAEVYAGAYFYFPNDPTVPACDNASLITISGAVTSVCFARIASKSKNLGLGYRDEAGGTWPYRTINTGVPIPQGRWFYIEVHAIVDATMGMAEIYLDGQKIGQVTRINNSGAGLIDDVYFGCPLYDGAGAMTYYIDDCAIDLPRLTVNSSPELNVPVYVDDAFVGNTPIIVELDPGTHTVRVDEEVTR
jgi:hypothetical protein